MTTRVNHLLATLATAALLAACQTRDPCEQTPASIFCAGNTETGATSTETGYSDDGEIDPECVPFENPSEQGYGFECQGIGNGWLEVAINPVGDRPPECVNWGDEGKPEDPTTDDCMPLDLDDLPNEVPTPGACCLEEAEVSQIETQCLRDCAFAACKLAVEKLREAAMTLSGGGAEAVARGDLLAFAGLLELPSNLENCAAEVQMGQGEVVPLVLGPGPSMPSQWGHVDNAVLHLQCDLDDEEPYIATGLGCDAPPNIPLIEDESDVTGVAASGAITVLGPNGQTHADLSDVRFEFTETLERDGSRAVRLTDFQALADTATHGAFTVIDPIVDLASPATGSVVGETGETIEFPAGVLRMRVTAVVTVDGEPLFGGRPATGEYVNTEVATATRRVDGTFAFVEAAFAVGDHRFVLDTEAGPFEPR